MDLIKFFLKHNEGQSLFHKVMVLLVIMKIKKSQTKELILASGNVFYDTVQ